MKTAVFWVATLSIFGLINAQIARQEATLRSGVTVLLELAPRDPRSLMQGDYMALDYVVARDARLQSAEKPRCLVVRADERGVGTFVRWDSGQPLTAGERRLRCRSADGRITVGSPSFFFQEGDASLYAAARFGEFKVAPNGDCVLVGLRNADLSRAGR